MKGIGATIASALPAASPWFSKDEASAAASTAQAALPDHAAAEAVDVGDLADLLKRHDDVLAAEQQSFNDRLANLLNTRQELPANDRRRLNALLAELLDQRDEAAGEHRDVNHDQVEPDQDQPVDAVAAEPAHDAVPEVAPAPEAVPTSVIFSFDQAVDGIVKSVNEDFSENEEASIISGQNVGGQSSG